MRRSVGFIVAAAATLSATGSAAAATITLRPSGTHALRAQRVVLAGERFGVSGVARGASRDALVLVTFNRGPVAVKRQRIRLGTNDRFATGLRPGSPGVVTVAARVMGQPVTARLRIRVLKPEAGAWRRGPQVAFLQLRLRALHYPVRPTGTMDGQTQRAVLAYRKVNAMARTTSASRRIFFKVAHGHGGYRVHAPRHGRHVEADLTHQVLALVERGGRVRRVYAMSSGRPSLRTPVGSYHVFEQHWGWYTGDLDPSFFVHPAGYPLTCGIHGYPDVPRYPASHCCLRVSVGDAGAVRSWVHMGTRVDVFRRRLASR